MQIELLYFDGCPSYERLLPRLGRILEDLAVADEVRLVRVETVEDAAALRFLGSPTLRIDGRDIDPDAADRDDFGLKCRLYGTPDGLQGVPPDELVTQAIRAAGGDART